MHTQGDAAAGTGVGATHRLVGGPTATAAELQWCYGLVLQSIGLRLAVWFLFFLI